MTVLRLACWPYELNVSAGQQKRAWWYQIGKTKLTVFLCERERQRKRKREREKERARALEGATVADNLVRSCVSLLGVWRFQSTLSAVLKSPVSVAVEHTGRRWL